jgi:putative nucleotidyltransferase with HDIG domain
MDKLISILKFSHENNYIGENVSQLEHFILAAQYAEDEYPLDTELIVAAFLHDIGHQPDCHGKDTMVDENGQTLGIHGHEIIGENYLRTMGFPERVCKLVGNHVKAKRYLACTNESYHKKLSQASSKTLALQGGIMSKNEAELFEKEKYFNDSITVRKYDELSKDISKLRKPLWELFEHYVNLTRIVLNG